MKNNYKSNNLSWLRWNQEKNETVSNELV